LLAVEDLMGHARVQRLPLGLRQATVGGGELRVGADHLLGR
jgi:hypothetical protein